MRKPVLLLIPAIFYFLSAFSQFSPGDYALKDVSVIDGISNNVKSHYTIVIHNNHIEEVGPVNQISDSGFCYCFLLSGKICNTRINRFPCAPGYRPIGRG